MPTCTEVSPVDPRSSPLQGVRRFVDNETSVTFRGGFFFPRYDARLHDGDEIQIQSAPHSTWMSFDASPLSVGNRVSLRGNKDGLICADEPISVRCNRDSIAADTQFEVVDAGGGKIALRGGRSGLFCSDTPLKMVCEAEVIGQNEMYEMTPLSGGRIALKGGRLDKYCTDMGRQMQVTCASSSLQDAGEFKPETETAAGAEILQTMDQTASGTFVVTRADLNSPHVALLCKGLGLYLAVRPDGMLSCASPIPRGFSFERFEGWDARAGAFRAQELGSAEETAAGGHTYLRALDPAATAQVKANGEDPNGWQQWNILLAAGFETVRPLVRGVNLANWFVLDRSMANELFFKEDGLMPFEDVCSSIDEHSLMESLGPDVARTRMEEHWASWIQEDDICWLAQSGLNAVRVPVGYWMVLPTPPFVEGQYRHLQQLFEWCEKFNIAVLLDFHGLKGSQNGEPSSGNCGACGNDDCGSTQVRFLEEKATNLAVIANLTSQFSSSPSYLGFQVANDLARTVDRAGTVEFYKEAYELIRAWNPGAVDVMAHTFGPSNYPFQNFHDVMHDQHISFPRLVGGATEDPQANLALVREELRAVERWPVLVGEWSLNSVRNWPDGFYADFAKTQIQAYEQHAQGWFYAAYKTAYEDKFNYKFQCERGRLPGCSDSWPLASADWWHTPSCAYSYLDGVCEYQAVGPMALSETPASLSAATEAGRRRGNASNTTTAAVHSSSAPFAASSSDARLDASSRGVALAGTKGIKVKSSIRDKSHV